MNTRFLRNFTIAFIAIVSAFTAASQDVCVLEGNETPETRATENLSKLPKLSDAFKSELGISVDAGRPVVIDFSASWCMPCLQFAPTFNQMATRYRGKIDMVGCDVDYHRGIASNYSVRSIPNILLFDAEGTPVKRFIGAPDLNTFTEALDELVTMGIDEIANDSESTYYTLDGVRVENPSEGIYIRVKGKETDVVRIGN